MVISIKLVARITIFFFIKFKNKNKRIALNLQRWAITVNIINVRRIEIWIIDFSSKEIYLDNKFYFNLNVTRKTILFQQGKTIVKENLKKENFLDIKMIMNL